MLSITGYNVKLWGIGSHHPRSKQIVNPACDVMLELVYFAGGV